MIAYWLAQLRPTFFAYAITAIASTLVMNVSTACGCLFSAAFNSVPLAMAYLVPFDYILMITSGVFMKLSTLPGYLSWMPYFSWLMYGNEAMSIAQWDGIMNISRFFPLKCFLVELKFNYFIVQHASPRTRQNFRAIRMARRSWIISTSRPITFT